MRVAALSERAELFYRRLLNVVDDYGMWFAHPTLILSACCPVLLERYRPEDAAMALEEMERARLILRWEVGGQEYLWVVDFQQQKRGPSRYPNPPAAVLGERGYGLVQGKGGLDLIDLRRESGGESGELGLCLAPVKPSPSSGGAEANRPIGDCPPSVEGRGERVEGRDNPPTPQRGGKARKRTEVVMLGECGLSDGAVGVGRALGRAFRRRDPERWQRHEVDLLAQLGEVPADEVEVVARYYAAAIPEKDDFRRRNLERLLRNWAGEVDRANQWARKQDRFDGEWGGVERRGKGVAS